MNFAEIMHILGNQGDLATRNRAIGGGHWRVDLGESRPIKKLLEHKYVQQHRSSLSKSQEGGYVEFNDFDVLTFKDTNIETGIKGKFLYPQTFLGCRIIARIVP